MSTTRPHTFAKLKDGDPVRQVGLPADARAQATLGRIDYCDCFMVDIAGLSEQDAERWARLVLEHAPPAMRQTLRRGWRMLGLKHGPLGSPEHVLGWRRRSSTPDVALLEARSRLGMPAELLFERRDDVLVFATLIEHRNPAMRLLWRAIEGRHRRVVSHLLRRARAQAAGAPASA